MSGRGFPLTQRHPGSQHPEQEVEQSLTWTGHCFSPGIGSLQSADNKHVAQALNFKVKHNNMASKMGKTRTQVFHFVFWILFLSLFNLSCGSIEDGGIITEDTTIHRWESPMLIKNHILVAKEATLTVEPGVELRFAPGVMLAVNGTLIAKVNQHLSNL